MPKLDDTQRPERLRRRLAALLTGEEVAARDIRALLTVEEVELLDQLWSEQQALRSKQRARSEQKRKDLGWKSKRDVQVQVLELALARATDNELDDWERRLRDAEVRQAHIYFDSYIRASDAGKNSLSSAAAANNDLTRAGLRRLDGGLVGRVNRRDRQVSAMEQQLVEQEQAKLSSDEQAQAALLDQERKPRKAAGKRK